MAGTALAGGLSLSSLAVGPAWAGTATNAGIFTVPTGTTLNVDLINSGTVTNSGTWIGNVISNTGTIDVNSGGTWNGDANNAATVTNAGTWTTTSAGFTNSGTLTTTGTLDATNGGLINTGTVTVTDNGTISGSVSSSGAAALFTGRGTVGTLTVSGGTFLPGTPGVPGTSMTIAGNLAFQSGALYVVNLNPATSSFATVAGTATLAGASVQAVFAPGGYIAKQYTILTVGGGIVGTFSGISGNVPAGFTESLSYTSTNVILNLTSTFGTVGGLNGNQQNVANTINNFFNTGGALPPAFASLFNLSGGNLGTALSQLDGEVATNAERGAFQLMNQFVGLMLDPYVDGRFGGGVSGFAPERDASLPPDIALAYAQVLKAPPRPPQDNRWSVWGTAFGGSSHADGDPNIGSNDVTANTYGLASGADYHFTRDTLVGFALAGAGTNWGLAQSLGSGRSDAFQGGVYGKTARGPIYLAVALAYTDNWFTTNRFALGDQLTARFNGESFGGRLESGYRFIVPSSEGEFEISPYAAIQAQSFHTPSYSETDLTGGGLGLNFNAMNATDTRSELGARFADMTAVNGMPLILRARLAWAHDWVDNPALNAAFQALPSSSFIVNGAPIASDSALASVGAELHMTTHWSATAKFDGEFAGNSQTYAGTGTLRYTW